MSKSSKIRVRFAPSPTGPFHIGSARSALFNYLFAKKHKGSFILRIEDTDKKRSKDKYEKDILDSLEWLGLKYDEKYKQSERIDIYEKYLKKLLDSGAAYKDKIIWFKNPNKKVVFNDLIRGKVEFDSSVFGDFSIAKSLKEPLYNFAAVIDDYEMKISHVIRGEDHISNTPKQILVYEALGLDIPKYAHLPLILGPDKSKLSKRHNAVSISEYKEYLPEALINFMALLGWSGQGQGRDDEIFSLKQLIKEFSLEKVQKGGAIFNIDKLDWLNAWYIRQLPIGELVKLCIPYLTGLIRPEFKMRQDPPAYGGYFPEISYEKNLEKIISLEQERLKKIPDIADMVEFFFKIGKYKVGLLKWKDMKKKEIKESLDIAYTILCDVKPFTASKLKDVLMKKAGEDRGKLLWPLRVALTGKEKSPGPFEIAEVLGRKESLKRIEKAIKML